MYIVAQHRIYDTALFWAAAEPLFATLSDEVQLLLKLIDAERRCCVCLWAAESLEAIAGRFDHAVGHVSVNSYFVVEESRATGLPRRPALSPG